MTQEIEISRINEAPYNPRVRLAPGMPDYEHLMRGIREFGLVEPLVWNKRTGNLVGGHQRLQVIKDIGTYQTVPCEVVDLSEEDEKVLNLALNKIKGEWDYDKLDAVLSEFEPVDAVLSGFAADELSILLASAEDDVIETDLPEWDSSDDVIAGNYVVQVQFDSAEDAQRWIDAEGMDAKCRQGNTSTVVRMGDAN